MQSYEIEYVVSGSLDGATPSPEFITTDKAPSTTSITPQSLSDDVVQPDDDNIYRFDVVNLGLIDPDFGVGGSFGDRFIVGLWINGPNVAVSPAPIAVVSTRTREHTQELVEDDLAGEDNFYREDCIFIPQGSYLGLIGWQAGVDPIIVRLHVKVPETLEEYALMLNSCCCGEVEGPIQTQTGNALVTVGQWMMPPGSSLVLVAKSVGVGQVDTVAADYLVALGFRDFGGGSASLTPVSQFQAIGTGGGRTFAYDAASESFRYQLQAAPGEVIDWKTEFDVIQAS